MRGKRKCFGLLLVLFIMLGLSLSVFSEDSSAVSDYTWTGSPAGNIVLCAPTNWNMQIPTCDGYNYLIWDNSISHDSDNTAHLEFSFLSSFTTGSLRIDPFYNYGVYGLPSLTSSDYIRFSVNNVIYFPGTYSFTLSDSLPTAECPECEVCPVIPDYPYEDDLTNIKNAVLLVGAVPIVIYFFYAIYKMIIGGVK